MTDTTAVTVFHTLDEVGGAVGRHLGTTHWVELSADRLDAYAQATGDDGEADCTEQRTAPPLLLLAMTNLFMPQIVEVRGASMGVNYGTGDVRFPAPVPVGSQVRGRAKLVACDELAGGIQTTIRIWVDVAGVDVPACVVDALSRWLR
jgi:acyl dehydratase